MHKPLLTLTLIATALTGCAAKNQSNSQSSAQPPQPGTLDYDRSVFGALLDHHTKLRRTVTELPYGIESLTESDDPEFAAKIKDHVAAMKIRLEEGRRLRQWDPLFVAMFDHADKITFTYEQTPRGIRARETSSDPYVAELIKVHARAVTGFVNEGNPAAQRAHPIPSPSQHAPQ